MRALRTARDARKPKMPGDAKRRIAAPVTGLLGVEAARRRWAKSAIVVIASAVILEEAECADMNASSSASFPRQLRVLSQRHPTLHGSNLDPFTPCLSSFNAISYPANIRLILSIRSHHNLWRAVNDRNVLATEELEGKAHFDRQMIPRKDLVLGNSQSPIKHAWQRRTTTAL